MEQPLFQGILSMVPYCDLYFWPWLWLLIVQFYWIMFLSWPIWLDNVLVMTNISVKCGFLSQRKMYHHNPTMQHHFFLLLFFIICMCVHLKSGFISQILFTRVDWCVEFCQGQFSCCCGFFLQVLNACCMQNLGLLSHSKRLVPRPPMVHSSVVGWIEKS